MLTFRLCRCTSFNNRIDVQCDCRYQGVDCCTQSDGPELVVAPVSVDSKVRAGAKHDNVQEKDHKTLMRGILNVNISDILIT